MKVLTNTTSPYARIARIGLAEKGYDLADTEIVNAWNDPPALLQNNPAGRVPTLVTPEGVPLTESLLILLWLEKKTPEPSLTEGPLDLIVSQAGLAMGVIDAMVQIMIGLMQIDPGFGESKIGLRRRRAIVTGMRALEAAPPKPHGPTPHIGVLTAVVALDYLRLRFEGAAWVEALPRLDALRASVADRPAYAATVPYV